jgi:isopenicillin N synthase-like dioxygenase
MAEIPMSKIPVIDIASFLSGADLRTAPRAVEAAASTVGFFQVTGHGVPAELLAAVYESMDRLAALPEEEKRRHLSEGHPYRGFHMNRDAEGKVRQERFLASRFDGKAEAIAAGVQEEKADFFYPNIWPEVPGLRESVNALFGATRALATEMMSLFAVALGLPKVYFDRDIEPTASTFAINHYPARGEPITTSEPPILFAEHADGNTLTILHQRGAYNGLQIMPYDGSEQWWSLPVVPEAFVINVGELMTRWTNDHWPATRHRVVASYNPDDVRTTLTTFHMPALEATVAPLALYGGDTDPHYEPVTPYEWERLFIARNYKSNALRVGDKVREFVDALKA